MKIKLDGVMETLLRWNLDERYRVHWRNNRLCIYRYEKN